MTDAPSPEAVLLVVDAANVVGSVPDGWWRDRRAAARRLRDALVPLAGLSLGDRVGTDASDWIRGSPVEVILVVEGAARDVEPVRGVQVVSAPGSGDDAIVAMVADAAESGRRSAVVTADRELRNRVQALGAVVLGPRTVYPPR